MADILPPSEPPRCSVEKIKEQVIRWFDNASSRRLFNWGRAADVPYRIKSWQGGG
jgi:hypothetical protein